MKFEQPITVPVSTKASGKPIVEQMLGKQETKPDSRPRTPVSAGRSSATES